MPDWISVAVGDGCTVAGIWKGWKEMKRFGLIDRLPRLLGVQARGAQPIVEAFAAGDEKERPRRAVDMALRSVFGNQPVDDLVEVSGPERHVLRQIRVVQ